MGQRKRGVVRFSSLALGLSLALGGGSLGCLEFDGPDDGTADLRVDPDRFERPDEALVSPEESVPGYYGLMAPETMPDTMPRAVVTKQDVLDIAVDSTHMFFTSMTDAATGAEAPSVVSLNLVTGERVTIPAVKADSYVANMASDATHVYWVDFGTGRVLRAAKSDGAVELVATGQAGPYGIAVGAIGVYWTNFADGSVMRADKQGGTPVALATGQNNPASIAVGGEYASWVNVGDGTVMSVRVDGQNLRELASGQSVSSSIVADDNFVYWSNDDAGAIMRSAVVMGKGHLFIPHQRGVADIAIDDGHIYWSSHRDNTVSRSDKMTASPMIIARSQSRPTRIAATDDYVYWNNAGSHTVVRLAK